MPIGEPTRRLNNPPPNQAVPTPALISLMHAFHNSVDQKPPSVSSMNTASIPGAGLNLEFPLEFIIDPANTSPAKGIWESGGEWGKEANGQSSLRCIFVQLLLAP